MRPLQIQGFAPQRTTWLLFELGGQLFGIAAGQLREVLLPADIMPLPGPRRDAWPGLMVWHERVLSVLDGGALLGGQPSLGAARARILVCQDGDAVWGLVVDKVRGLQRRDEASCIPVQPGLRAPWHAVQALLPLSEAQDAEVGALLRLSRLWEPGADGRGVAGAVGAVGRAESRT